jgi:hypothetical protein
MKNNLTTQVVVVKEAVIEKYFISTYRALKEKAGVL